MTEDGAIKRLGPPAPRDVKGRVFTWTMPLNVAPPPPWKSFFTATKDRGIICNPDRVRFYLATLIFESDEVNVPTWIEFIDRWMASANERFAKYEEEQQSARAALEEQQKDPAQRLREAAEKFKHL